MLVLRRSRGESIVINDDITITVVEIREDRVRLGIVAPKEVPVHRQEVYDAIRGSALEHAQASVFLAAQQSVASVGEEPVPDLVVEVKLADA